MNNIELTSCELIIQSVEANKKINKFLRKDLEEIEKLLTL